MAKGFKDFLKELPLDAKDQQLIQVTHELELELELLKKEHQHELQHELLKKDHELQHELLKKEHQHELQHELLKKDHELQHELLKKEHQHEIEKLTIKLSEVNWQNLKHLKLVELRSFVCEFDTRKLNQTISERADRFADFAKKNVAQLKAWNLEVEHFIKLFKPLYSKLCGSAHPTFNINDKFEIGASHLEHREIQLIGFLWEAFPLPPEKLEIRTLEKSESVASKYRHVKNK